MFLRTCLVVLILFASSSLPLRAQNSQQIQMLKSAVNAGKDGDWDAGRSALANADSLTRDLFTWTRLRDGEGSFAEYQAFLAAHPDWPGLARLRSRAEPKIEETFDAVQVAAWFETEDPDTGAGMLAYAKALTELGRASEANAYLAKAWVSVGMDEDEHNALIDAFGDTLAPYHVARADAMLWRWRSDDAERLLPLLNADQTAVVRARIGFIRKSSNASQLYSEVPSALRNDVGLAYDRYSWLASRGEQTQAIEILRARSTSAQSLGQPFRWSGWRRSLARWKMRDGDFALAYELAANHYLTADDGFNFVDLEWIAGYVALRFLDKPEIALEHFKTGLGAVESPISLAQSGYWLGRTYEALGDQASARTAYAAAAQHQTAYYGLLAGEKLGRSLDIVLTGQEPFPDWRGAAFLQTDIGRGALALLGANERTSAVLFVMELAQTLDREGVAQLGNMLGDMNEPFFQVLVAKTAVRRGIIIHSSYFPLHDLAKMEIPVDASLALAVARRESEFNEVVGSPVGALGLMQVMPATAEEVAGKLGLPYSKGRLTADWEYNAKIGTRYLEMLQEQFGPSPVLIASGYNAGPSRPVRWMEQRGDPRLGEVDVIDWVEMIPFRETRNYVQRVSEAIPIYEARLTGNTGPIRFTRLLQGFKPVARPQMRPTSSGLATASPVSLFLDAGPAPSALRPKFRGN